ncbi:DPP IV N-terminal domain-containing protein, partial [Streptomyces sp. NPDC004647]|uniref:DPP IV N-terminal domain-containing protein n=1 Tax=Streptomyces sp. NPDC004647 TaxID=3154671 RepID=UPI0033B16DE3
METSAIPDFPRRFARTRRFSLGVPRQFTVSPDGERILFLRTGGGSDPVSRLWLLEEDGSGAARAEDRARVLADPLALDAGTGVPEEERIRRERAGERAEGVVAYATDREARMAAFALEGALWAVRTDGGAPFAVRTPGPVVDPRPSPDGRHIAYVTGGALHVVDVAGGGSRLLAAPDGPEVTYGLAEHVAAESMGRLRGHWWAPDGRSLLAARVDTSPVQRWYIADPAHPHLPPRSVPYPAAGTANALVSLLVLGLDGSRTAVEWDRAAFEYVVDARWDAHGPLITVQCRDQRTLRVLTADPATGTTEVLHEQRDAAWVQLMPGTPARTASGALVRPYEEEDTRGLRVGPDGRTPPGLQVRQVLGTAGERVLFTASEDPMETHVWGYEPGGGCVRLSEGPGLHTAVAGGGTVVLESRTPDGHRVSVLREDGPAGRIACHAEEPGVDPRPAFLSLGDRSLRSALYLPSWYEPGAAKLPVLLDPYGGPAVQVAVRARTWLACVSQWFAEQGFAVLVADGRGTPGRGPEWDKEIRGDTLGPALEDQVDALHAAAAHCPDLDLSRVAIRGWSYGGYLAAGAVLRRPDGGQPAGGGGGGGGAGAGAGAPVGGEGG